MRRQWCSPRHAEFFIAKLMCRVWAATLEGKHRTVYMEDVIDVVR
jgi:hypothetical protein